MSTPSSQRDMDNSIDDPEDTEVYTCLRIKEPQRSICETSMEVLTDNVVSVRDTYLQKTFHFGFDHICTPFGDRDIGMDDELFNVVHENVTQDVLNGFNVSVITYGKVGSGKTHCLFGADFTPEEEEQEESDEEDEEKDRGFLSLLAEDLFAQFDADSEDGIEYNVTVTACEVFCDQAVDLLAKSDLLNEEEHEHGENCSHDHDHHHCHKHGHSHSKKVPDKHGPSTPTKKKLPGGVPTHALRIREHPVTGPFVENLTSVEIEDADELISVVQEANNNRHVRATALNESGSHRGHCILKMYIERSMEPVKDRRGKGFRNTILTIVDLAGISRNFDQEKYDVHDKCFDRGHRDDTTIEERKSINISLTALGVLIDDINGAEEKMRRRMKRKMSSGKEVDMPFVAFRRNLLTWLLKESLWGNSKTAFVFTVYPEIAHHEETLSTMLFAERVKNLKTKVLLVEDEDPYIRIIELKRRVMLLRKELEKYRVPKFPKASQTEYVEIKDDSLDDNSKEVQTDLSGEEVDGMMAEIQKYQETILKMGKAIEDLENEIDELTERIGIKDGEIGELRTEIEQKDEEWERKMEEMKAEYEEMLEKERKEKEEMSQKLDEISNALAKTERELAVFKKKDSLKDQIITLKDQSIQKLRTKINDLEKDCSRKENAVRALMAGQSLLQSDEERKEALKDFSLQDLLDEISRRDGNVNRFPELQKSLEQANEMTNNHHVLSWLPALTLYSTSHPKESMRVLEEASKHAGAGASDFNHACGLLADVLGDRDKALKFIDRALEDEHDEDKYEDLQKLRVRVYQKLTEALKGMRNDDPKALREDEDRTFSFINDMFLKQAEAVSNGSGVGEDMKGKLENSQYKGYDRAYFELLKNLKKNLVKVEKKMTPEMNEEELKTQISLKDKEIFDMNEQLEEQENEMNEALAKQQKRFDVVLRRKVKEISEMKKRIEELEHSADAGADESDDDFEDEAHQDEDHHPSVGALDEDEGESDEVDEVDEDDEVDEVDEEEEGEQL